MSSARKMVRLMRSITDFYQRPYNVRRVLFCQLIGFVVVSTAFMLVGHTLDESGTSFVQWAIIGSGGGAVVVATATMLLLASVDFLRTGKSFFCFLSEVRNDRTGFVFQAVSKSAKNGSARQSMPPLISKAHEEFTSTTRRLMVSLALSVAPLLLGATVLSVG